MTDLYPFPDEFTTAGSSHYYAVRFAPHHLQSPLSLATAFYLSVRRIPAQCSDPGVAHEKLRWWREELERSYQGEAVHPVARRLPQLMHDLSLPDDHITPLFSSVEREITGAIPVDQAQMEAHSRQTTGLLSELLTRIGGGTEDELQLARDLGCFIRQVEIMRDMGRDLRAHRCFFPLEQLQRYGLEPSDLFSLQAAPALDRMLKEMADNQHRRYRGIIHKLPAVRPALGPVLRHSAIADAMLRELSREGSGLLRQRTSLTPLRKLWIAWRCR